MLYSMASLICGIRICLEIIGAVTVVSILGWIAMQIESKDVANHRSTNSAGRPQVPQKDIDAKKRFHRICAADNQGTDSVGIEVADQSRGHECPPDVKPTNIDTEHTNATWNGIEKLSIAYPTCANKDNAFVSMLGVRVILNPVLRSHNLY
jgi:hypothetical protein